jgi:hypothetical protein
MYSNKFSNRLLMTVTTILMALATLTACQEDDIERSGKDSVTYTDAQGKKVAVPFGSMSCALKVISCTGGSSSHEIGLNHILGAPNANSAVSGSNFTLSDRGEVTLEFGVYITDGKGDDIHVFEKGSNMCELKVEVSDNLSSWIYAGDVGVASLGLDIAGNTSSGAKYRYIRLTNVSGTAVSIDGVAVLHPEKIGSGQINGDIEFSDTRGNKITLPGGALSCATFVVSFNHGSPWMSFPGYMNPDFILGAPTGDNDYEVITLGCGGVIVVGFNVYITDGPGNDIYVFEVGPDVEATKVEVSADLVNWIHVGDADGSISGVDINGKVPKGAKYRYVRLTDLKTACGSSYPGADINAVGVIYPAFD